MTNMNSKRAWRQWAILAVLVGMLLLPLILVGLWVHAKHQWGQEQLATLEPRYARLLGMQQQEEEIQQALKRVAQAKANHIYPGRTIPPRLAMPYNSVCARQWIELVCLL